MATGRSRFYFNFFDLATVVGRVAMGSLCWWLVTACDDAPSVSQPPETPAQTSAADSAPPPPPPPPSSAFIALLTPEQTAQIRTLGLPLVVPTAVPTGFAVEQVEVRQDGRFSGYQILYQDGSDRCFVIEFTSGGVGGIPDTENRIPINPPLVTEPADYGLNYGYFVDPNIREGSPGPELISDWLPVDSGFYRIAGATYANRFLAPGQPCQDIEVAEAVSILESSTLVTDEIQGDGVVPQ